MSIFHHRSVLALSAALALASGCAHYLPKPLAPAKAMSALETRSLDDPGLQEFIARNSPGLAKEWPRPRWALPALTLAAFYYHPDLDVARAKWGASRAG